MFIKKRLQKSFFKKRFSPMFSCMQTFSLLFNHLDSCNKKIARKQIARNLPSIKLDYSVWVTWSKQWRNLHALYVYDSRMGWRLPQSESFSTVDNQGKEYYI